MPRSASARAGYTLVALVIGIAVLTILLAAVGPVIATVMKRDREEELIFRGRQYARAIALFQRRYGRYPNTLKEMYESRPRTIRKLWKDPMCRCSDWHLLIAGTPDSIPFNPVPGGQPTPGTGLPPPRPTPTPGVFGNPEAPAGPIAGVRSNVHEQALREWRGHKYYDEWGFIAGDADDQRQAPPGGYRNPPPPVRQQPN
ncbi:MAG TPA: type II secretion system protein [Thermoanaerobaculia bacterium]|nr:type II secretion system protein [Thermoanaerobaculia bacterium]